MADPTTDSISLGDIMQQVSAYKAGASAATAKLTDLSKQQADLSSQDAATYTAAAVDSSTVEAAKQAAALQTQANNIKVANAFGTNMGNVNEQLTKYAAMADSAQQEKDAALAEIDRKSHVTIFDNPVEYMMNKFTINTDIDQHNAANAILASANERIASINANTQASVRTQNEISEPITAASAAAATRLAAVKATTLANESARTALAYNAQGITAALNSSKEVLAMDFNALNAKNAETNIGISLQHLALARDAAAERIKEFNQRMADKEDMQAFGSSFIDTINKGAAIRTGGTAAPLDPMQSKMILTALKNKSPIGAGLMADYNVGERSTIAGVPMIGASPAQAVETLSSSNFSLTPKQQQIRDSVLSAAVNDIKQAHVPGSPAAKQFPGLAAVDFKDAAGTSAALNQHAQDILNKFGSVVLPGTGNPYEVASINQLGSASPVVAALPVYQKVFAPLLAKGVQITDPKQAMDLTGKAVAAGIITHQEALELTTIYQVGVKTNLATSNFPGMGLVPTRSYNSRVETDPSALFGKDSVIDMTKPDQVSKALIKVQAAHLAAKLSLTNKVDTSNPTAIFN